MQRFKNWVAPPVFEGDVRKTNKSGLLNTILLALIPGPVIFFVSAVLIQSNPTRSLVINFITFCVLFGLLLLLRYGFVNLAATGTVILLFLTISIVAALHKGVNSSVFSGFIMVVIVAGLLLGKRSAYITAFLSVCLGLLFLILFRLDFVPFANYLIFPDISTWVILSVFLGITSVFVGASRSTTNKALLETEQRLSEQTVGQSTLHESEETVRALLEAIPDVIFRIDRSGVFIDYISARDFDTLVPPEEFMGKTIEGVLTPELAKLTRQRLKKTFDENRVQTFEYSLAIESDLKYFEARMVKFDANSILAIIREVTPRIIAKQKNEGMLAVLERRNTQLRIAAEVAKTCSSILDPDLLVQKAVDLIQRGFKLYYVGLFLVDVKGNSAILIAGSGEAGKKMLAEGYHLEIEAASMIAWCIRNGKARIAQDADMDRVRYQNPLLPKTRSELALPLFSRGQVIGALTVQDARENAFNETDIASLQTMSDQLATAVENANLFEEAQKEITERRAIEKSLRVSEQKFSKVFHSGPDSVTLSEMESGRLIEVNDGFREVFGYSREEAIGHSALELGLYQNPEDRQFVMQTLRKRGSIRNLELTGRHKSGQAFTAFLSAELIEINERSHLITIVRDITERKLAEEEREKLINELEIKNAELERFTYTVSHDLKSPLITIRGFLGYLEKDAIEGNIERLKSDVNRISSAAKTMQLLLDELLELSRVGRLMNEPEEVAFETIVHEALGLVEGRLGDGNIKILVDPDLPLIYADRARLIEVIQNLVDNAAKYVKNQPNPKIEIGVRNKAENPVFYVKDNGVGIDPKYHEKVFGLFEKLDTSSEGTGVGLALVKRIVEVHGGRIWIESESGKGATFCFTLSEK